MVVFDTTFLAMMFVPGARHPIADAEKRINHLIGFLSGRGDRIVIPTPALSELLVKVGNARDRIVKDLTKNPRFLIAPFDTASAVELSLMTDSAINTAGKKHGSEATWAKVKFDRQIVSIAKVLRVTCIYSDDGDVKSIGHREGVSVYGVGDIIVPSSAQSEFQLTSPEPPRIRY
jgi:hypothetical protein